MNFLGLGRPPEGVPAVAPTCEAMAASLNARGMPHQAFGVEFPPGVWVDVTPGQAAQLDWLEWAAVREKEVPVG